jgi:hypothetical protein
MKKLALVFLPLILIACSSAQSRQQRPEILVLGTYHMANPGQDIFNMQVDDVLSSKRQKEIAQLLEVLKRFHPTKIAVESPVYRDRVQKEYAQYLEGKYQLSRNEIDQIGYRLAKELGMKTIYPVDYDGEFPMERLLNFTKAKGKSQQLDQLMSEMGEMVKELDSYLKSHTVLETMQYVNSDNHVAQDVGFYYRQAH